MEFPAQQIADPLNGTIEGNPNVKVSNPFKMEEGKPGTLALLANLKYVHYIYNTEVSIVLANNGFKPEQPMKATLVKVENAYVALTMLLNLVEQSGSKRGEVDSIAFVATSAIMGDDCCVGNFAHIGEDAKMDKDCMVYPHAYIGDHVTVGDNCTFYPHATVYENCIAGNNYILYAGSIVGADGFGFISEGEAYKKTPQSGNAITEDDVETGASTVADHAVMDFMIIRRDVKLDNLTQIAHNVEVGENIVMAAQAGIVGSVKVGKRCMFGGQVGLVGYIHVMDHIVFGAQAGVISGVKETTTSLGVSVISVKSFTCSSAIFNHLPDVYYSLGQMQREIEQSKKEINK